MNAPQHTQAALKTDQGKKLIRNQDPDIVPEVAVFTEPMQPRSTVRPYVLDHRIVETFIGGAGI
jgi:hypothetical protein